MLISLKPFLHLHPNNDKININNHHYHHRGLHRYHQHLHLMTRTIGTLLAERVPPPRTASTPLLINLENTLPFIETPSIGVRDTYY